MTKHIVEKFCPACVAVPLIFASGGTALVANGTMTPEEQERQERNKRIVTCVSIMLMLLSIGVFVYYRYYADCTSCKLSE
jgi:hypothetical protein